MLKDYFEVPNKPAIKSGNVLSCDFTDHETFIPQPLDFTRNTLATYVDCNGIIKVSGVSDTELVTNGDFSDGSTGWSLGTGWSIINGVAKHTGSTGNLATSASLTISKVYKVQFEIVSIADGVCNIYDTGSATTYASFNTTGVKSIYITKDSTSSLAIRSNSTNATIDNVSVKEVDLNVPRIDYLTEIGKAKELQKPSLLLEPQSTNLVTQSNNPYSLEQVTKTSVLSPEGINNAFRLTETTANAQHYAQILSSVTSGVVHSISFFIKKGNGYTTAKIYTQSVRINSDVTINFETKSITLAGTHIVAGSEKLETYPNGWFRVSYSATPITTGSMYIYAVVKDLSSYIGSTDNYIDYYGFQVEQQNYATSYIPTSGSTVTRNVELCDNAGQRGVFNNEEGTIYVEFTELGFTNPSQTSIVVSQENSSNNRLLLFRGSGSNWSFQVRAASVNVVSNSINLTTTETLNKFAKVAIRYKTGETTAFVNGSQSFTNNSTFTFNSELDKFGFIPYDSAVNNNFYGRVKDVKVFRRTLTDSEMTELTNNIT